MTTNYDDVYLRNLILGVLSHFRDKVQISQITSDSNQTIDVQFLYSYSTNSEDWYMDFYLDKDKQVCTKDMTDDGNTITVPSGIFSLSGISINQGGATQKNERASYQRIEENILGQEVNDYSARINFVPITANGSFKIKCSSEIQRFKIWAAIIDTFYNHGNFKFHYGGIDIPAYIKFPQNYNVVDSNVSFKYPGKDKPILDFSVDISTTYPIIDKQTERKKSVEEYLVSHSKDSNKITVQ